MTPPQHQPQPQYQPQNQPQQQYQPQNQQQPQYQPQFQPQQQAAEGMAAMSLGGGGGGGGGGAQAALRNPPGRWKLFVSHVQAEAKSEALRLYYELGGKPAVWLDVMMGDPGEEAMMEGVEGSEVFLLILSESYFDRPFCVKELRRAQACGKRVVLAHLSSAKSKLSALFDKARRLDLGDIGKEASVELLFHDPDHAEVAIKKVKRACGLA